MINTKQLRLLRDNGVTSISSALAMDFLYRYHGESITMTEVSNHCNVATASASEMVDRLEKAGLVSRSKAVSNRRISFVKLTKQGVQKWRKAA